MMAAVFSMQGLGQLAAGLVALITCVGFKESLMTSKDAAHCTGVCGLAVDKMWRILIGFGAVPGCIALYFRLTIPETPRYTFDVARDLVKGGSDAKAYLSGVAEGVPDEVERVKAVAADSQAMEIPQASWSDFVSHYSKWKYGSVLLGTAGSWFLLDVAFYGLGLNNAVILQAIGFSGGRYAFYFDNRPN
jgi:PHS family inorganic phosphate transporter-like MFS transporter